MRIKYIFFALLIGVVGYSFVRINLKSPEDLLVGNWTEDSWKYERVGSINELDTYCNDSLSNNMKEHLGKDLLLHTNETWDFLPNGELHVHVPGEEKHILYWRLKGKGDMLVIKDENKNPLEHYKVTHLSKDSLLLGFELDIQMKGLASMTFKKQH